ncbi:MAG: nucleotidyltransferase domain-containing protein [Ferruginibacter sp.]
MSTQPKKHPPHNSELAKLFHQLAACYRYLGPAEHFRALAYENASRIMLNMKEDIAEHASGVASLDAIAGIGESIAGKIIEYLGTGRITTLEKIKKQVPFSLLELMDIEGIGPATIRTLFEKCNIQNKDELVKALAGNRLEGLPGFGSRKIANLRYVLKMEKQGQRMPLATAQKIAEELAQLIARFAGVEKVTLAGSLRRQQATIGDIDLVVLAKPGKRKRIINQFTRLPIIARVLAAGSTRASVLLKNEKVQADLRLVQPDEYGAALLYFTGSKEHNIRLRTIARERGLKINEYGIYDLATGKKIAGETEEEMYRALQMDYIPPQKRVNKGEIEAAMHKAMPA